MAVDRARPPIDKPLARAHVGRSRAIGGPSGLGGHPAGWPSIDSAGDDLVAKGVEMERYEGFSQDEKGIARADEGPPIAWFTDPSDNILAVLEAG